MTEQPRDYTVLPPEVPREETVALQLDEPTRFGGPEGGGGPIAADGDGD